MSFLRIVRICLLLFGMVLAPITDLPASDCVSNTSPNAIQQAINNATTTGAVICIEPGIYKENITMRANVSLQGNELGRTILENANTLSTSAVITLANNSDLNNLIIHNQNTGIGIKAAAGITDVNIKNVVITDSLTGLECIDSKITITNSVFYKNTTAINCQGNAAVMIITNSIISDNTTDVTPATINTINGTSSHNLLFSNATSNFFPSIFTTFAIYQDDSHDPLFVAPDNNDFHLKATSPARNAGSIDGSLADIGAYGGPDADPIPFQVSGLKITAGSNTNDLNLKWDANNAYNITHYSIYFDTDASGLLDGSAQEGPSPLDVAVPTVTASLTNISFPPLAAPVNVSTLPGNTAIVVTWSAVTNATGYRIHYGTSSGNYPPPLDVGNTTLYKITGLTNNELIYIAVEAYNNPTFYAGIVAVDDQGNKSKPLGYIHSFPTSSTYYSLLSSEVTDYAEAGVMFPDLPNEYNCFIATAAFGSNLAPQVTLLRQFRNHYLLPNTIGRWVVALYYRLSPDAAAVISKHEWLKSAARTTLYPAIGLAALCLKTGPIFKIISTILVLAAAAVFLFRRLR
ncbi:MAG: hypothetical protein A2511_00815 [Deltaproteobacteria bacterium RIFOXYD12_FULL_50_9]|nr:MAG: hypothetical protein A2511_00815 [Deltaproteobacteria bacterium RIFOXYD12_FULL_50_9]